VFNKVNKNENRLARHKRVRKKISGTPERPRMNVFKSARNIYVQIIDDINRVTLVSASTIDKEINLDGVYAGNKEAAKKWEISDRRVRKLCLEGKIADAYQEGKTWRIPFDAQNPLMEDIKLKNHSSLLLNAN